MNFKNKVKCSHEVGLAIDHAITFLNENKSKQPFSLTVSFNATHAEDSDKENQFPWPPSSDKLYQNTIVPPPLLSDPKIFESMPSFLKKSINRERFYWRWDTPEKYQKNMIAYFRMLSGIDTGIGRVIKELDRLNLDDNTIIIYMSDNGYYMGNRGFAGKWSHFEESLRIPLIIYDPNLPNAKSGVVNDSMSLNVDIAPTIIDYAGIKLPESYQGHSLLPQVQQTPLLKWRNNFFCEHLMNHGGIPKWEGIRGERYVYARYFEQKPIFEFLHDLKNDPQELVNYSSDIEYQTVLNEMRTHCDKLKNKYESAR